MEDKAYILLENGDFFEGKSFGKKGEAFGEICFNTSMVGYQEILTDPSYSEQVIVMTYPEIGNYGINKDDLESEKVHAKGFIIKNYCDDESHYKSTQTLNDFLKNNNVVGIHSVDTRKLTLTIREQGAMRCAITTSKIDDSLKTKLQSWKMPHDVAQNSSKNKIMKIKGTGVKIGILDLGVKNSIIKNFEKFDCDIEIFPLKNAEEIIKNGNFDAILFSNGPGDPQDAKEAITLAKSLFEKLPLYGICLGYQILALALGAQTYKLKYGHRGANHPVLNLENDKVIITSQNHGYAICGENLPEDIKVTYKNLNDDTIEGFRCEKLNIEGVQFHPEASPGPYDAKGIFAKWIEDIKNAKK